MAGRPKRRAILEELELRARDLSDTATPLDYVAQWTRDGRTLKRLAVELEAAMPSLGMIGRDYVRSILAETYGEEATDKALSRARLTGSHALVEEAQQILDDVPEDREAIAKATAQANFRARMAGWWNREEFGERAAPNVTVTIGELHIDAMRARAIPNPLQARAQLAQVEEAQEVEVLLTSGDTT